MPIRLKLLLASLLLATITAGLGLFAIRAERELGALAVRVYDEAVMSVGYARSAQTAFTALRGQYAVAAAREEVLASLPPPAPSERQRLLAVARGEPAVAPAPPRAGVSEVEAKAVAAAVAEDLDIVLERAMSPAGRDAAGALRQEVVTLPDRLAGRAPAEALALFERVASGFEKLVETTAADGFAYRARAEALAAETERATWVAVGTAMLAALAVTLLLSQAIVPAIRRAALVTASITEGKLDSDIRVPGTLWRSETASLLRGLAAMQAAIREDRAHIAAMNEERERTRAEAEAAKIAALETMARQLEAEADSTLTRIGAQMEQVIAEADGMTQAARVVSVNSSTVAEAAGEALGNANVVAAATEELSSSIAEISRLVGDAAGVARRAVERSEASGATIRGLTETVSRIGQVSRLIAEIAGRTNLLALNATIEAARAGEAGRGFAVVASEVKSLAAQTAAATEDIARQIAEIGSATDHAVATVDHIRATIAEMDGASSAIAAAVEQQTAATREIARAVSDAAGAVHQVSNRIAEVSSATTNTRGRADTVRQGAIDARAAVAELRRVLVRVVRTTVPEVDRRAHPRLRGPEVGAHLLSSGRCIPVTMADLSVGGAQVILVERAAVPGPGQQLRMQVEGLASPLDCEVLGSTDEGNLRLRFLPSEAERADLIGLLEQLRSPEAAGSMASKKAHRAA